MTNHRSKWKLFGKFVLFCLLVETCGGESSEEKESEEEDGVVPAEEPELKESQEDAEEEVTEPPPPLKSRNKKKMKSKGFKDPHTVGKSKSSKNFTGFAYGFSANEKKSEKWKSFGFPGF